MLQQHCCHMKEDGINEMPAKSGPRILSSSKIQHESKEEEEEERREKERKQNKNKQRTRQIQKQCAKHNRWISGVTKATQCNYECIHTCIQKLNTPIGGFDETGRAGGSGKKREQ